MAVTDRVLAAGGAGNERDAIKSSLLGLNATVNKRQDDLEAVVKSLNDHMNHTQTSSDAKISELVGGVGAKIAGLVDGIDQRLKNHTQAVDTQLKSLHDALDSSKLAGGSNSTGGQAQVDASVVDARLKTVDARLQAVQDSLAAHAGTGGATPSNLSDHVSIEVKLQTLLERVESLVSVGVGGGSTAPSAAENAAAAEAATATAAANAAAEEAAAAKKAADDATKEAAAAKAKMASAALEAADAKASVVEAQAMLSRVIAANERVRRADDDLPTLEEAAQAVADATAAQAAADKALADAQKVAAEKEATQKQAAIELARKEAVASKAAANAAAKKTASLAVAAEAKKTAAAQTTPAVAARGSDADYAEYTFYVSVAILVAFVAKVILIDAFGMLGREPTKETFSLPPKELNKRPSKALIRESSLGPRTTSTNSIGSRGSLPPDGAPTSPTVEHVPIATAWGSDEHLGVVGQGVSPTHRTLLGARV